MEAMIEREQEQYYKAMDMMYEEKLEEAKISEARYLSAKLLADTAKEQMAKEKEKLIELDSQGVELTELMVKKSKRKGNVDMKFLQFKYDIDDETLDSMRKDDIEVVSIVRKK